MVVRTSTRDAAQRAQSNAARATVREMNSKTLWNEGKKIDVMAGETATDVEFVENYGSTMVPAKQDPDDEEQQQGQQQASNGGGDAGPGGKGGGAAELDKQPKGDSAEAIVLYVDGSRSHPVMISVGDRRHRLVELEEGDVANHRLKDDRQQVLLSKDGTYISTRDDKIMRVALVPKETKDQQQQGQQTRGGGQAAQGKKEKSYGQKSAKDDNKKSTVVIEQNGKENFLQHGQFHASTRGGSDSSTYHQDRKHSAQATDSHVHVRFEDNRIWVDVDGHWSESPIMQKKDRHCKD